MLKKYEGKQWGKRWKRVIINRKQVCVDCGREYDAGTEMLLSSKLERGGEGKYRDVRIGACCAGEDAVKKNLDEMVRYRHGVSNAR